jgi:hypothetical protein
MGDGDGDAGCMTDDDCVAASHTDDPCYSPGCELPVAASQTEVDADDCFLEWSSVEAPAKTNECTLYSDDPVTCPAACAVPPTCVLPYCEAGTCKLVMEQDGSACEKNSGTGGGASTLDDCETLDAARDAALEAARECLTNGTVPECTAGDTVPNECGCPVFVNDNQPDKVSAAEAAYDAWNAKCEAPEKCALVDCLADTGNGQCVAGAGDQGMCAPADL